jgi:hypothetical protein
LKVLSKNYNFDISNNTSELTERKGSNMFLTRLQPLKLFGILTIVISIAIFIPAVEGAAQKPDQRPPGTPHYHNKSVLSINTVIPATATELALAMGVPDGDLLAADLMGSDPTAVGVSNSSLGSWFPTEGSTFAILSTGHAADATLPNDSDLSTVLVGLNNDQDNDLVRLHLQLKVPGDINCAGFDFAFYSEEYPEYVGCDHNDTFTAQLDDSFLSVDQNNNVVVAPHNFAFDANANAVSVNTSFGVTETSGTPYNGATIRYRAIRGVVPGATIHLYLSIQDLGDSYADSAVFLDNFSWCSMGVSAKIYLPIIIR